MLKISLIVPFYNAEKYLTTLYDALGINDFIDGEEIILLDNCSTDNSRYICKEMVEIEPKLNKNIFIMQ